MRPLTFMTDRISRFLRDESGNISIETVIVIPLLLFLTTGGLTYWNAFNSNSRTAKVAYTMADIMSRHDAVDSTDMEYLYELQNKLLPGNVLERSVRISSICLEDGEYKVLWSYSKAGQDTQALPALKQEDVPIGIMPTMAPQDSIILVELSGSWTPQFLNVGLSGATWENALVIRPRFVKIIPHTVLNPSKICPVDPTGGSGGSGGTTGPGTVTVPIDPPGTGVTTGL